MKKIYAFTLAEVLITMTLIGVIAALSIPTITTGIKTKALETQVKKVPQLINNAILANIAKGKGSPLELVFSQQNSDNEGDNTDFSLQNATRFAEYLSQNLDVVDSYNSDEFTDSRTFCLKDGACVTVLGNIGQASGFIQQPQVQNGQTQENIELNLGHCGTRNLNIGGSRQARRNNPCLVLIDVNGEKSPNSFLKNDSEERGLADRFILYITDSGAIIDPNNNRVQRVFGN